MWIGTAVMGVLLVYVALRGPKITAPFQPDTEATPDTAVADSTATR